VVILIGGVGYAGKTFMAQKLLEKYKYPYLSIDHLKMGIYRSDSNCGFTPLDSFEHIGEKLWGILKGIIMTNIENNQNLIIEGCYLLPYKIKELEECDGEYSENIISFYLGFSKKYIEKNFKSEILKHMGAIEARTPDGDEVQEIYICENIEMKQIYENYGAKYFEIDENYLKEIESVYDWIDKEMSQRQN
jgi:putative acetyltransferase